MATPSSEFENNDQITYKVIWREPNSGDLKGSNVKEADGLCFSPQMKNPKILINPKLKFKRKLQVLIEECYHAFFFDEPEYKAKKFAKVLSYFIMQIIKKEAKD